MKGDDKVNYTFRSSSSSGSSTGPDSSSQSGKLVSPVTDQTARQPTAQGTLASLMNGKQPAQQQQDQLQTMNLSGYQHYQFNRTQQSGNQQDNSNVASNNIIGADNNNNGKQLNQRKLASYNLYMSNDGTDSPGNDSTFSSDNIFNSMSRLPQTETGPGGQAVGQLKQTAGGKKMTGAQAGKADGGPYISGAGAGNKDELPTYEDVTNEEWSLITRQNVMPFDYPFMLFGMIPSDSRTMQAERTLKKNTEEFEEDPINIKSATPGSPYNIITSPGSTGTSAKNSNPLNPLTAHQFGGGTEQAGISTISGGGGGKNDDSVESSSQGSDISKSAGSQAKLIIDNHYYQYGSRLFLIIKQIYCRLVCLFLWSAVFRTGSAIFLANEKSMILLDFYYLGKSRLYYLIPALCLSIQSAAISMVFIRNAASTNWLVPFYSSKDYLIQLKNAFKPSVADHSRRLNVNCAIATLVSMAVTGGLGCHIYFAMMGIELDADAAQTERIYIIIWIIYNMLWALFSTCTCVYASLYFNVICSIMRARFQRIAKIIESLAESETTKSSNQSRKITALYLEHNEACELLDESNDFWQYLIFFTYFTYIPGHCYCMYNLFFVDFDFWLNFATWTMYLYTGFIICLNSFSASGVSTEAHAPYSSLHTLSLIQLPVEVEVNISTFLHRVRGLTIGYSCYDLFAVTNASMSNTAAACASYFLIVADFSRSAVFTTSQQVSNATGAATTAATTAASVASTVVASINNSVVAESTTAIALSNTSI